MPNGRSGGFMILKDQLRSILEKYPATERLAQLAKGPGSTTQEALEALAAFPRNEVRVEEQDASWYIIHLDPAMYGEASPLNSDFWFVVSEESPVHADLVGEHRRWVERLGL